MDRGELAGRPRRPVYVRVLKSELDSLRAVSDAAWQEAAAQALRRQPSVEEVARVIDPLAFDHPTVHPQHLARRRNDALDLARQIAALHQGKGEP